VALVGGSLLGLALRLAAFVAAATVVHFVGVLSGVLPALPALSASLDPVYTHAALNSLADLHLQGLAVAGPAGDWLHASLPGVFVDPQRAHWAPIRLVVQPGSPVLARLVAAALAHATVLGSGLLVARAAWRRRNTGWLLAGIAVQIQVALGILGSRPSTVELESTGVSFAASALLPWLVQRSGTLSDSLDQLSAPLVAAALVGLALLVGYLPAALLLLVKGHARAVTLGMATVVVLTSAACAGVIQQDLATAAPLDAHAAADPQPVAVLPAAAAPVPVPPVNAFDLSFDRWFDQASPAPSHVEVVGSNDKFQYLVNGQPETIKGMGLNTQYSYFMNPTDRAAQLDSDMAALSALGVNTVLGWDPAEFDGVLLDAAERHGIGVVMPFDLDPNADYTDPLVRQQLHDQALTWVARYRKHPALRMWGLGNEVLHKIVHPAWVGPQDPQRERQAEAFSDWLIQTADDIHTADPDHPVTYRSAEDAFVGWLAAAMQRDGNQPRPWFVLGTNCYQAYLSEIVDNWPTSGMPTALWVSEFAPGGIAVPDRPDGFATLWGDVTRHPDWVLGGAVYAWTRNGPEGVDRNFGLTDDGTPVDGRSLDMLNTLFHSE
jgi:hypothetical protein